MDAKGALKSFIRAWKKGDWQEAAKFTQVTWRSKQESPDESLRELLEYVQPPQKKLKLVVSIACVAHFQSKDGVRPCMMICEAGPYMPSPEGQWGVNPLSLLHHCGVA